MRRGWILASVVSWLSFSIEGMAGISLRLPPAATVEGLGVGGASRAYEPLTAFESVEAIRRGGAAVVELHSGQILATNQLDAVVGEGLTEEQTLNLRRQAGGIGMRLVAARVRFGNNPSSITRLFEWADRLGLQVVVGDVPSEQFDHVERMVRQFNIGVGLPMSEERNAAGRGGWSDPKSILASLRGRDTRIGVVVNLLRLVRAGYEPFGILEELRSRLVGIQMVDLSEISERARPVPFGTGKMDFRRLLEDLHTQRFGGYLVFDAPSESAEFKDDLRTGMAFFRKEMESIRTSNSLRQAARGAAVPEGLKYEVVVQGDIPEPVRVGRSPDGVVWFGSRRGAVWTWTPDLRAKVLAVHFPVSTSGQRGLYGFEFDPGFATNRFLYVYRSPMLSSGNSNRVSRFTASRESGVWKVALDSERVLLDIPSSSHGVQQGGGILLHPREGCLYLGTGDNLLPEQTPRVYDDPKIYPQNLLDLRGKILRIGLDGSIPADNPFARVKDARPEVYAFGLRNPFTLSWLPSTGEVLVGDVGFDRMRDWEEVDLVRPGANYGWPRCDGQGRDTLSGSPCPLPDVAAPWFAYPHDSAAAVIVGPVVGRAPAGWPEVYQNGLFYSDHSRRTIRFAQIDPKHNAVTNSIPFASGLAGGVLSMTLGADGDLYLVEYSGNLSGSPEDRVSRIAPVAK